MSSNSRQGSLSIPSAENSGESGGGFGSSGFSFMSGGPTSAASNGDDQPSALGGAGSGFSFLNSSTDATEPPVVSNSNTRSSFAFLSSPSVGAPDDESGEHQYNTTSQTNNSNTNNNASGKDLLSMTEVSQDLKLNRVASTKVVKKKKKAGRVGFGRGDDGRDDGGDDETVASTTSAAVTPATAAMATGALPTPDVSMNLGGAMEESYHHNQPYDTTATAVTTAETAYNEQQQQQQQQQQSQQYEQQQQQQQDTNISIDPSSAAAASSASSSQAYLEHLQQQQQQQSSHNPYYTAADVATRYRSTSSSLHQYHQQPFHQYSQQQPETVQPVAQSAEHQPAQQKQTQQSAPQQQQPLAEANNRSDGSISPPPPSYRPELPPAIPQTATAAAAAVDDHHSNSNSNSNTSSFNFLNNGSQQQQQQPPPAPIQPPPPAAATAASSNSNGNSPVILSIPPHILQELTMTSNQLDGNLQAFFHLYQQAYLQYLALLQDIGSLAKRINDLHGKIDLSEQKQAQYALQEDFDAADQMSIEIESIHAEINSCQARKSQLLGTIQGMKQAYEQEKVSLLQGLQVSISSVTISCQAAKDAQLLTKGKLADYLTEEYDRIAVEEERVSLERNHCTREEETLRNENAVVEEAIKNQVGDYYEKKQDLEAQSLGVQEEIRRLEELLAVKKLEEMEIHRSLKTIDGKISEVRKKYDRQLQRIAERLETLGRAQQECAVEELFIRENKERIGKLDEAAKLSITQLGQIVDGKAQQSVLAKLLIEDAVSTEAAAMVRSSFSLDYSWYATNSEEIYHLFVNSTSSGGQQQPSTSEQVSKIDAQLRSIFTSIEEKKVTWQYTLQRQKTCLETIDRLEMEKKSHASNKRFKEAAATAKELKENLEMKESIEQENQAQQVEIQTLETEYASLQAQVTSLRQQLKEEQKVEKLLHYQIICSRMKEIRGMQRKMKKQQQAAVVAAVPTPFSQMMETLYGEEYTRLQEIQGLLMVQCDITAPAVEVDDEEEEEAVLEVAAVQQEEQQAEDGKKEDEAEENKAAKKKMDITAVETVDEEEQVPAISETAAVQPAEEEEEAAVELQAQIDALELDLQAAAEAEDFDQAAVLQDQITELIEKLDNL